jgi:hypothetical protein
MATLALKPVYKEGLMRKALKWIGITSGSLFGLLVVAGMVLFARSNVPQMEGYEIDTTE